jgi:hypothetical protein
MSFHSYRIDYDDPFQGYMPDFIRVTKHEWNPTLLLSYIYDMCLLEQVDFLSNFLM